MKYSTPSLVAALSIPAMTSAYSLGTFYSPFARTLGACRPGTSCGPMSSSLEELFSPLELRSSRRLANRMMKSKSELFKQAFQDYSPRYQIVDDDEQFAVSLDVPGVKSEDISISLEEDGQVLALKGSRASSKEGYSYSSDFSQRFYVDPSVDTDKFVANLANGVLTVSAPKDMKKIEETVKSIPITESPPEPVAIKTDENPVTAGGEEVKDDTDSAEEVINLDNTPDAEDEEKKEEKN